MSLGGEKGESGPLLGPGTWPTRAPQALQPWGSGSCLRPGLALGPGGEREGSELKRPP